MSQRQGHEVHHSEGRRTTATRRAVPRRSKAPGSTTRSPSHANHSSPFRRKAKRRKRTKNRTQRVRWGMKRRFGWYVIDPSAGSPTETLLRLLLPLSDKIYLTFREQLKEVHSPKDSPDHSKSVVATGGVYKGQGRNQCELMTRVY